MKILNYLLVYVMVLLASAPRVSLFAQFWGDDGMEVVSHSLVNGAMSQGPFSHAEIAGDYLYFTDGFGFNIHDLTNPGSPVETGKTPLPGFSTHFALSGAYAYVCVSFGFCVVDVSDPESPSMKNYVFTEFQPFQVIVQNGVAFAATKQSLISYSLSDPENPLLLDDLYIPPSNVELAGITNFGDYIYYANQRYLHVVNASDPADLQMLGMQEFNSGTCWGNLTVSNGHLYVVVTSALHIYDLADPASPSLVYASIPGSGSIYDIVIDGNRLVINHWSSGSWRICDISDPALPVLLYQSDSFPFFGSYSLGTLENNLLVVLDNGQQGYRGYTVHIIDISEPSSPQEISALQSLPGYSVSVDLLVRGGRKYALVAQDNRLSDSFSGMLRIQDITDPDNPLPVSTLEFPTSCVTVAAGGDDYLFVRGYNYNWPVYGHYLYLVSISNLNNPQILKEIYLCTAYSYEQHSSLCFRNGYLYAAAANQLKIFQVISNSLSLTGAVNIYGQNGYTVVYPGSGFAYVAGGQNGLHIYDVSNPAAPIMHTWGDTPGTCMDVVVHDGIAYCADYEYGLQIFDVSQNTVVYQGNYITPSAAKSVSYYQGIAYLGLLDGRLAMIDVTVPNAPVLLGLYMPAGQARDMMVNRDDGYFLLAEQYGLSVMIPKLTVGIEEKRDIHNLAKIYPNPANEWTTLEFALEKAETLIIRVFGMNGSLVDHLPERSFLPGIHQVRLNTGMLRDGLYLVELIAGDVRFSEKIIVTR